MEVRVNSDNTVKGKWNVITDLGNGSIPCIEAWDTKEEAMDVAMAIKEEYSDPSWASHNFQLSVTVKYIN